MSKILKEECHAFYIMLAPIYLRPPSTKEEWGQVSSEFLGLWNMPHVIGAIDGKHVVIKCQQIPVHFIAIIRNVSLRYYLIYAIQNINLLSS